jgi:uncharacterized protein YoxC
MTILNEKIVELANALVEEIKESFDGASMHQELSLEIEQVKEFVEDRFKDISNELEQDVNDKVSNLDFVTEDSISDFVTAGDFKDLELEIESHTDAVNDLRREFDVLKNLLTESLTHQRDAIDNQLTLFKWAMNQGGNTEPYN